MIVEELQKRLDAALAELEAAKSDAQHWKTNHDNVTAKLKIAIQRPDLPVDRIPAIQRLEQLQTENGQLRAKLAGEKLSPDKLVEQRMRELGLVE